MLKKKQVLTMISIAVMSFLIGTTFNIMSFAEDSDGNPFDEIWDAIYELEAGVGSLNQTIEDLKTKIPRKPIILTNVNTTGMYLVHNYWHDLISLPNVTVWEGVKVLAIGTACFRLTDSEDIFGFTLRHRVNNTFSEVRKVRAGGFEYGVGVMDYEIVEIHQVWINLTAGTYTFAIQYYQYGDPVYAYSRRLTLIIF
jgi:hypothetical protein